MGLWSGEYEGINRTWLRWYDGSGQWILTPSEEKAVVQEELEAERERAAIVQEELATERERTAVVQEELEAQRQRADAERSQRQRLEELLRSQGIDLDSIT